MLHWLRNFFSAPADNSAGAHGERAAADWLARQRNFQVIAKNWRSPHDRRDEIDLVCRDRDVLVFVEVKARAAGALVRGYYAVDRRKKRVLRRSIDAYLRQLREKPRTFRFDIVEVSTASATVEQQVRHFENVPLFSKHFRA
jgi:putative endonuclease